MRNYAVFAARFSQPFVWFDLVDRFCTGGVDFFAIN